MENKSSRNRWKRLLLIFVIYRQVQLDPGGMHNQMLVLSGMYEFKTGPDAPRRIGTLST